MGKSFDDHSKIGRVTNALTHLNVEIVVLIIQFQLSVAMNMMGSFLPLFLNAELNYSLIEATRWTGVASLISSSFYAISSPFWGYMCDRVGVKKILLRAILFNTVCYMGTAFSTDISHVLFFRGLQGAMGGISTVTFTIIALTVSQSRLKMALGYQMAAMTMGSLIGPGIGGLLVTVFGYRWTFVVASLFIGSLTPLVMMVKLPSSEKRDGGENSFKIADLKAIMPYMASLILVYISIGFIQPIIPWFLESLGVPSNQLLTYTAIVTVLNGLAYGLATPVFTRIIKDKTIPIVSAVGAVIIFSMAFLTTAYQFIALRCALSVAQSGIPPNLLGGKSGMKGTAMGILNSARFIGGAVGPYISTSILGDGVAPKPFYMFTVITGITLSSSLIIYLIQKKNSSL